MHKTAVFLLFALLGCQAPQTTDSIYFPAAEKKLIASLSPLGEAPKDQSNPLEDNPKIQHFGQYLYYENRLSANGEISCATCHDPNKGLSDQRALSKGLKELPRHSPSIWNNAFQRWYFWDGRSDSLWAQAVQPLENDLEMGMDRLQLLRVFQSETDLKAAYQELFGPLPELQTQYQNAMPLPQTPQDPRHIHWQSLHPSDQKKINLFLLNITRSIAAFERQFISGESAFDQYVHHLKNGSLDPKASPLSPEAQKGLKLFIGRGKCILCHTGPFFSDREFHNIGLSENKDPGRFEGIPALKIDPFNGLGSYAGLPLEHRQNKRLRYLIQQESNRGEMKTPSLREIAESAPYMHDGRFKTLQEVLAFYNRGGDQPALGRKEDTLQALNLSPEELAYLEAFLKSLSTLKPPVSLFQKPLSPLP